MTAVGAPRARFVFTHPSDGHTVAEADTLSGLVDRLLVGHADRTPQAQLERRADSLAQACQVAQSAVLAGVDLAGAGEDALGVLLHDRRCEVPVFDRWESDIPLFLLASGYAPYTPVPRPAGDRIVWADPHTERTFVDGLAACGLGCLWTADDSDGDGDGDGPACGADR